MRKKQIIEKDGIQYEVVRIVKEKQNRVIVNNWDLTEYEKWYDKKYCMAAVKEDGGSLQYVKEQSPEICIEAVKQNGYSLQFVKEQSPEICIEAVKTNGYSLRYVDKRIFTKSKSEND